MYWNKQKIQLVVIISVLLITGFLVTSFSSYLVARTSLRSEIFQNGLPLTSDNIYSEIQQDLLRPVFISSLMASDTFLRDWVIDGELEEQQISRYLKEIQTKYNTLTSFFVSERTKNYYYGEGILKKVSSEEERDQWYFRVRKLEGDYEINVDPDLANQDKMTIFINYKVFDYDGNYIGATGVGLNVDAVTSMLQLYQKKYDRLVYFLDKNGAMTLAAADPDSKVRMNSRLEYYSQNLEKFGSNTGSSFSYRMDGQLIHANIRYIEEFQWYLVVEQSEEKILLKIYKTLLINLLILLIVLGLVLFFVVLSVTAYQKRIETLRGIVPICSFCKQIRDDKGYWNRVESYIAKHTEAQFSHSVCPSCMEKHYPEAWEVIEKKKSSL